MFKSEELQKLADEITENRRNLERLRKKRDKRFEEMSTGKGKPGSFKE